MHIHLPTTFHFFLFLFFSFQFLINPALLFKKSVTQLSLNFVIGPDSYIGKHIMHARSAKNIFVVISLNHPLSLEKKTKQDVFPPNIFELTTEMNSSRSGQIGEVQQVKE